MRYEVGGLVIGDEALCPIYGGEFSGYRVHAAKDKCHKAAVSYSGSLPKYHHEYLTARRGIDLYLNIVDAPVPIFRCEIFTAALDFIDEGLRVGLPAAIHCNKGFSRAPSIAALYLAKRAKTFPGASWAEAKEAMRAVFPQFEPGAGIDIFLAGAWEAIT